MTLQVNPRFNRIISSSMARHTINSGMGIGSQGILKIYKGAIPSSGDFVRWSSYEASRNADLLATLSNASIENDKSSIYFTTNAPTPTPGSANGTATWAALIGAFVNSPAIIGSVSDSTGDGVFRLNDTSINTIDNIVVIGFRLQW